MGMLVALSSAGKQLLVFQQNQRTAEALKLSG
jgi:hypothetical protein